MIMTVYQEDGSVSQNTPTLAIFQSNSILFLFLSNSNKYNISMSYFNISNNSKKQSGNFILKIIPKTFK